MLLQGAPFTSTLAGASVEVKSATINEQTNDVIPTEGGIFSPKDVKISHRTKVSLRSK